jgi:glycerol-3-phosphate cytidylyltransferase-like family protein
MDYVTEGYGCLVIDNTTRSNKLEENVFWYEAEMHEPYTLGNKMFWQAHNQNYVSDDDDEEFDKTFDITKIANKKKLNIHVNRVL